MLIHTFRAETARAFLVGILGLALWIGGSSRSAADEPVDWANWRGPEQNGISREKNLPDRWSPRGENLVWRHAGYETRCTPIGMNGRIYFVARAFSETTQEGERTVCLDAATGELVWESVHNIFLSDAPAERVGWASVVGDPETGHVYVLGLGCLLQCLHGETGETLWERPLNEQSGMLSTYGGRTNFPVVFEDLLIVSGVMTQWGEHAVPAHRFVAFDKLTGEPVWFMSTRLRPEDTTYSTPIFTVFNGEAAMVVGAADGSLYAIQPRTGKVIWQYHVSLRGFNTTPVIDGDRVYCGHAEKNLSDTTVLGAMFAVDGRSRGDIAESQVLWKNMAKTVGRSAPLLVDGKLYAVEDGGTLLVMDPETGTVIEQKKVGRIMFGSLLYADGKIYCAEATGNFWVFQPTAEGLKELSRTRINNEEILSSPIAYRGRIYLTSTEAIY
ncbi:MAG TPA: PQQ-binding-like beta-propeller repeat protein, partial [Pirellulaceae bacterium]|nr:PQQ-binding-like beta-propeller repeat protein [Pirellulaceae bacterium]